MNLLAIDTTGAALSLALQAGERTIIFHKELSLPHDETLLPRTRRLLDRAGLRWGDLDALAAASGPGRFTGIRIGMAFTAVMARRLRVPALAVSRFAALAASAPGKLVCAVLPGYRDESFYQLYRRAPSGEMRPAGGPVWAAAEDWERARREIAARGAVFAESAVRAADLITCAERLLRGNRRTPFEPLYLKPASYERKNHKARMPR